MSSWILHPVVPFALLAVGLSLALYLFLTVKLEIRALLKKHDALARAAGEMPTALKSLESDVREIELASALLGAPTPRSGLNLNKRSQALRMGRRGETPEQIAAALGLAKNEVDLLLKVHDLTMEQV